jgi:hypothetical protein
MYKVATATYTNNKLALDEKLGYIEGQRLKIIIFDERKAKKDDFLEFVNRNSFNLPADYKFDRDEANER